jgi:hypothetical protein
MQAFQSHPGLHGRSLSFKPSIETFGICSIPLALKVSADMRNSACEPSQVSNIPQYSMHEISALLIKSKTSIPTTGEKYAYLAQQQGTRYAILPVHTHQEIELFKFLQNRLFSGREPDWIQFTKEWSGHCNGNTVFYKTPEHLKKYDSQWIDSRTYANTINCNREIVDVVRNSLQSKRRKISIPPAQPLLIPPPPMPNMIPPMIPRARILLPADPHTSRQTRAQIPAGRKPKTCHHCKQPRCRGAYKRSDCPLLANNH